MTPPAPSAEEARDRAAFAAVLWALSRPGSVRDLPEPGEGCVAAALLDRECLAHAAEPALEAVVARSGAVASEIDAACHVLLGAPGEAAVLRRVAVGSDLYPDRGASVIARARLGDGARLRLTGPGVDGARDVEVGGLPGGFWAEREAAIRYPVGFDLILVDGARVMGLPRSCRVEAL